MTDTKLTPTSRSFPLIWSTRSSIGENSRIKVQNVDVASTALIVRESNPFALELGLENRVLLPDIVNDVLLMPIHPASNGHEKELP